MFIIYNEELRYKDELDMIKNETYQFLFYKTEHIRKTKKSPRLIYAEHIDKFYGLDVYTHSNDLINIITINSQKEILSIRGISDRREEYYTEKTVPDKTNQMTAYFKFCVKYDNRSQERHNDFLYKFKKYQERHKTEIRNFRETLYGRKPTKMAVENLYTNGFTTKNRMKAFYIYDFYKNLNSHTKSDIEKLTKRIYNNSHPNYCYLLTGELLFFEALSFNQDVLITTNFMYLATLLGVAIHNTSSCSKIFRTCGITKKHRNIINEKVEAIFNGKNLKNCDTIKIYFKGLILLYLYNHLRGSLSVANEKNDYSFIGVIVEKYLYLYRQFLHDGIKSRNPHTKAFYGIITFFIETIRNRINRYTTYFHIYKEIETDMLQALNMFQLQAQPEKIYLVHQIDLQGKIEKRFIIHNDNCNQDIIRDLESLINCKVNSRFIVEHTTNGFNVTNQVFDNELKNYQLIELPVGRIKEIRDKLYNTWRTLGNKNNLRSKKTITRDITDIRQQILEDLKYQRKTT